MKKIAIILSLCLVIIGSFSCKDEPIPIQFKDLEKLSIYDYIVENKDKYSSFLSILEKGGLDKTLSAYNREGDGYTLFLPDNDAVDAFIAQSDKFSSLDDLLNDSVYSAQFCRYHVVNQKIDANDFPFGAFSEYTLTDDFLTVSFITLTDTAYYKINNQAPVIKTNIELSNGFIHLISIALSPITYTAYGWLEEHPGYSIFKAAVEATGLDETLNINTKLEESALPVTLFIEHDSIFNKKGIYSFDDLANFISPGNTDYTNTLNPLYNFIAYHILTDNKFLDDFVTYNTNYSTYSDIPLTVDGTGTDIKINKWKEIFDTIIDGPDTTYIDYIGFLYDASNVLTQTGVIHFIDQVMTQQTPSKAEVTFEFWNERLLVDYRNEGKLGSYLIEDSTSLNVVKYSGTDLFFVMEDPTIYTGAWTGDYLYLDGDFTISYTVPKIVQGTYKVVLNADAYDALDAVVEVFIDGKNVGGLIDLSTQGGTQTTPFQGIDLGTINFIKYETHTIEVRSLIPGRFYWDYISFQDPLKI
jgi:uncharacterized surface protein with fasciclin (FAS1) repeats